MEPRPSGTMILDIDEALATEQTRLEVKRCYPHVGNALIRTHEVEEGQPHKNVMKLLAMVSKEYMDDSQDAQDYWDEIMERWIHSMFHNLGNCMKIYNRRQRKEDGIELYFDFLDLELQNRTYTISFALDSNSDIKPDTASMATKCRNAMVKGELGEGVVHVVMPSAKSLKIQKAAGEVARAEREAAEAAAEAAKEAERQAEIERRREEAQENFMEAPDDEIAKEESAMETLEEHMAQYEFPVVDFEMDFRYWDVYAADGTVRQYDSATGEFVQDIQSA